MNRNGLLFTQIQSLPPNMHDKWKEKFDFNCQATNGKSQGPTPDKKSIELKDNSYCPAFSQSYSINQMNMDMKFEIQEEAPPH